jgi:hypothetical protein
MGQPRAFVASDDGVFFVAHVDYDVAGPFRFCNGPRGKAGVVVGWSRAHATTVLVRVGEQMFSAGQDSIHGIPPWDGPVDEWSPSQRLPRRWHVKAQTSVLPEGLIPTLAEHARRSLDTQGAIRDVLVCGRGATLTLAFSVPGADEAHAHAAAFQALNNVWRSAPFDTRASYDTSSVSVREI